MTRMVNNKRTGESAAVEETDIFCPNCGFQSVLVENTEGDYYVGPTHYCKSCMYAFTFQAGGVEKDLEFEVLGE